MINFIKSINKLKNFGSFRDFSKDTTLPEFKQVNLFYGYNASGKTTLTRVFSCLNNGGFVMPELEGCELGILVNDKVIKNLSESPIKNKIRIFNSDFIEDNLQLKEGQAKKLSAVIGKENIDIKRDITKLEEKLKFLKNDKGELNISVELSQVKKQLDDCYTTIASEIKGALNLEQNSYKKNHFENDYKSYKSLSSSPNKIINKITDEEKRQAVSIFTSKEKQKIDQTYIEAFKNIEAALSANDFNNSIELLKKPIKRKTAELKEKVIKWIEEGACIHQEDHSKCQFCGQKIPDFHWNTRVNEIKEIIKKDDDLLKLEEEFEDNKKKIDNFHKTILQFSCDLKPNDFITTKLFEEYQKNRQLFDMSFKDFKKYFEILMKKTTDEKHNNKDTVVIFDDASGFMEATDKLKQAITNTIKSIEDNNKYVSKSDSSKNESRKKVIYYYIQTHYEELTKLENDINIQTENEKQAGKNVQSIEQEIESKTLLLSNQKLIIEKINTLLKNFLDTKLVFKFETDSYSIEREINGQHKPAKKLSDGEKSLIAFLYFIISLESSSKNEKENEIIVIDDPVSSFDSHNLFNIQALLTRSVTDYGQIFFLTHNFYFFAKIRDALKYKFKQSKTAIFEIENRKNAGSILKCASEYIKNHISEYMSLIEKLKDIKDVSTGNLIRRVLEVFLSFKVPNEKKLYVKFQSIAGNDNKYPGLLNMVNAFSHTAEISSITDVSDFSYTAGRQEIEELFKFIQENDEKHFEGLELNFKNNLQIKRDCKYETTF
ncbi:MAG: AAA family ATPase [Endomicrobium sp.]|jgi:wobble nucleotide-excising tRNase|nr:AAA family ATPase [Endomicrobium sp.]